MGGGRRCSRHACKFQGIFKNGTRFPAAQFGTSIASEQQCVCGGRRNVYLGKRKMANTTCCAQQTFCACHDRQRSIHDSNEYSALFQCAEGTLSSHHAFKKSNKLQNQDIKRTKIQKKIQERKRSEGSEHSPRRINNPHDGVLEPNAA